MLMTETSMSRHRTVDCADTDLLRFHVFDGSTRIVIEVHSEHDAHCLCADMGWELICCCES